jgi:hypothetical protein
MAQHGHHAQLSTADEMGSRTSTNGRSQRPSLECIVVLARNFALLVTGVARRVAPRVT